MSYNVGRTVIGEGPHSSAPALLHGGRPQRVSMGWAATPNPRRWTSPEHVISSALSTSARSRHGPHANRMRPPAAVAGGRGTVTGTPAAALMGGWSIPRHEWSGGGGAMGAPPHSPLLTTAAHAAHMCLAVGRAGMSRAFSSREDQRVHGGSVRSVAAAASTSGTATAPSPSSPSSMAVPPAPYLLPGHWEKLMSKAPIGKQRVLKRCGLRKGGSGGGGVHRWKSSRNAFYLVQRVVSDPRHIYGD